MVAGTSGSGARAAGAAGTEATGGGGGAARLFPRCGNGLEYEVGRRGGCGGGRRPDGHVAPFGYGVQAGDQAAVVTGRLRLGRFQHRKDQLDGIQRLQDGRNRLGGYLQFTVAELAQHIFRRVSDMLQARQTQGNRRFP